MTAHINLEIGKGARYDKTFIWKDENQTPVPLSIYSGRMHIRKTVDSATIDFELTTENGGMTLEANAETGRIDLYIGATDTDTAPYSKGEYDIELYEPADPDNVVRLIRGIVTFTKGITR